MKSLRIRFALGFCLLYTIFLTIAFIIVYVSNAGYRKEEFYNRLKDRALTSFRLLVEVEQIDHELLKVIDKNTLNSLYDEKVMIFEDTTLVYSSIDDKTIRYDSDFLAQVKKEKEIHTTNGDDELVAIYNPQNGQNFIILAEAYDKYGRRKIVFLKWAIIAVYCIGILFGWLATYFFVKRVIKPLDTLKNKLQNITSTNLHTRLPQSGQGEELDNLSSNVNQLLERLQQSFSIQKDFVHYASHELRTPLTAMVGVTENALSKRMDTAAYEAALRQLFQQQQNLTQITNSLLLLSDNKIITNDRDYPLIRLDELVFRSVEIIQNIFPGAEIQVNLEGKTMQEETLLVQANEPLLMMAFNNLLKNALLYSTDKHAYVTIRFFEKSKEVEFRNTGAFIGEEESKMIFTPFYRAGNTGSAKGHGLGLALVKQIADIHSATIEYTRKEPFNIFCFRFDTTRLDTGIKSGSKPVK